MLDYSKVGVRWTVGDVSERGFEALRLSIAGATRIFGRRASYAVVVNSISVAEAQRRTGSVPPGVGWHAANFEDCPTFLRDALDAGMAEGVAWKFAPVRVFPRLYEIALDNDCIIWKLPESMAEWLENANARQCLLSDDVNRMFGRFAVICGQKAKNTGIRGFPPGLHFHECLRRVLLDFPVTLRSELDEQGLQTAAMSLKGDPVAVTTDEVSICSPFYPHQPNPGTSGAHFVGLNARSFGWQYFGRPAIECRQEHYDNLRPFLFRNVGLEISEVIEQAG